jgi:hypothetical protein
MLNVHSLCNTLWMFPDTSDFGGHDYPANRPHFYASTACEQRKSNKYTKAGASLSLPSQTNKHVFFLLESEVGKKTVYAPGPISSNLESRGLCPTHDSCILPPNDRLPPRDDSGRLWFKIPLNVQHTRVSEILVEASVCPAT